MRLATEPIVARPRTRRPVLRARWAPEEEQRIVAEVHPDAEQALIEALSNNAEEAVVNELVGPAARQAVERFATEQNIPRNAGERAALANLADVEARAEAEANAPDDGPLDFRQLLTSLRPILDDEPALRARLGTLNDRQREQLARLLEREAGHSV